MLAVNCFIPGLKRGWVWFSSLCAFSFQERRFYWASVKHFYIANRSGRAVLKAWVFCSEARYNLIWGPEKPRVWNTSRNGLWINFSFEENLSKELFLTVFSPEARSLGLVEAVYLRNSNSMWTWKDINPSTSWSHNRISDTGGCLRKSLCREMSVSLSLLSLKAASGSRPWDVLVLPGVWVVFWAGWGSAVRSALQMCSSSKINCNSKPNTDIALERSKGKVGQGGFPPFPNLSVL